MKKLIRNILNNFGYDIVKENFKLSKKYKINSDREGEYLFDTALGKFYVPKNLKNDVISIAISKGILFDHNIIALTKSIINEGDCVLDVGANYGQMSVHLSKLVGESGKIYSFEAEPYVFSILEDNIKLNNCSNVQPVFGAVHKQNNIDLIFPEPDFLRFTSYGSYGLDFKAVKGRKVKTITIDSLEIKEKIGFMKIDVQGADLYAMQGAIETIKKNKMPILFEFEQQFQENFGTTFQDYVEFVHSINYKFETTIDEINYLIVPK